ncbi:MAG: hypothetical protein PHH85_06000 [Candidatus Methanoperedens sp.]|nr:hypothetical protein [Candidatus Methanoperedens sp.]
MNNHSHVYIEFENNVLNLRRLSYGMRYLDEKKKEFIKYLKEQKGETFPEDVFAQELKDTIYLQIEVSNILLRKYIEDFGYKKCGSFEKFLKQYKNEIDSYTMNYQRNMPQLSVLDINRDLRNQSIHSEPTYRLIKSSKKPIQILSEQVVRITNTSGEKEIVLLHDLNKNDIKQLLDETFKKMAPANTHTSFMLYGEILREEILECIRQIDLI